MKYEIRPIRKDEYPLLRDFTYKAIFQPDEKNLLPRQIVDTPPLRVFYENFGKKDDICLVVEADGAVVGAAWTRIIAGDVKGFGNIDEKTPEFAIALKHAYRGRGLGTSLMRGMLALLREKGYARVSLSVQRENAAVRLYEKVGFRIAKDKGEELIMVCAL